MPRTLLLFATLAVLTALWLTLAGEKERVGTPVPAGNSPAGSVIEPFAESPAPPTVSGAAHGGRSAPAEESSAEPIPARPARPARYGSLRVSVRTAAGESVEDCELELLRELRGERRVRSRGAVDGSGRLLFDLLRPDTYFLRVVPASLPEGFLAPYDQDYAPAVQMPGFHLAPATVRAGETTEVALLVHRAARLHGYLRGPGGAPWSAGAIRLLYRALSHVSYNVEPDETGFYDFGPLVPGTYGVKVLFLERVANSNGEEIHLQVPPIPDILLPPGAVQRLDVDLGPGPVSVGGRVVDEEGRPMADLFVVCAYGRAPSEDQPLDHVLRLSTFLARVRTDTDGHFEFPGVHRASIWITPGAGECQMHAAYGENRLAQYGRAHFYDISGSPGRFDAGTHIVSRSRPFRVRGVIEIDPVWAAGRRTPLEDLILEVRFDTPRGGEHGHFPGIHVEYDPRTGAFDWWCESFHAEVVFSVRSRPSEARVEFPFQPFDGGDLEGLRVPFPR